MLGMKGNDSKERGWKKGWQGCDVKDSKERTSTKGWPDMERKRN